MRATGQRRPDGGSADPGALLETRQGADWTASADTVDAELSLRLPAHSVLEHIARAAHWTGWWHRPRPHSGSDPKVKNPLSRYTVTTFT